MHEHKTPLPPNTGRGIQSFVSVLGSEFIKQQQQQQHMIGQT